jgi:hypothetical protein
MNMKDIAALIRARRDADNRKKAVPGTPLGELYLKAVSRYRNRCFWGMLPEPSEKGMIDIYDRLRSYGDLDAWLIAEGIRGEIEKNPISFTEEKTGFSNFFEPVDDPDCGRRDHIVDLSIDMLLSMSVRSHARDIANVWLINEHVMPLWHLLWASCCKDDGWNPISMGRTILTYASHSEPVMSDVPPDAPASIGKMVSDLYQQAAYAEEVYSAFRGIKPGCVFLNELGDLVNDPDEVIAGLDDDTVRATRGSFNSSRSFNAAPDHDLLERLITEWRQEPPMQMAM